jgi:hypothetical protein
VLNAYARHYNGHARTGPDSYVHPDRTTRSPPDQPDGSGRRTVLGGLLNEYKPAA